MTTITFQGRAYTPEVLATMTIQELLDLHNRLAALTEGVEVSTFVDDRTAQEITWALLSGDGPPEPLPKGTSRSKVDDEFEAAKPTKPAPKTSRKKLFKFPAEKEIRPPKAGTLRGEVLEALRRGVTYNDVIVIVKEFDARRGVDVKNADRRAYEVIRLLHYYCGYGMDQSPEGVIKVTG